MAKNQQSIPEHDDAQKGLFCDLNQKEACCDKAQVPAKVDAKTHWEKVYQSSETSKLGWYEEDPESSLRLIRRCGLSPDTRILNIGAGATTLIDHLLDQGFKNLLATDISEAALASLQSRLGPERSARVEWIVDDLTAPQSLPGLEPVGLWHDRAVLHFFTEAADRKVYFDLLRKLVKSKGFVIIAAFNFQGAEKCSGLPVYRYDAALIGEYLGAGFTLMEAFDYDYQMPSGDLRPYVYTLFKRK